MKLVSHKKMRWWGYLIWANISTFLAFAVAVAIFNSIPFWKTGIIFLMGYFWCMFIFYIAKIKRLE